MDKEQIQRIIDKYFTEINAMEMDFKAFKEKYPNNVEQISKMNHRLNILLDFGVTANLIFKNK